MAYKITITQSEYPHNETKQITVTAEQLIQAILNEYEYEIIVESIDADISGNMIEIHSTEAYLDYEEGSMSDAVFNGLSNLMGENEEQ